MLAIKMLAMWCDLSRLMDIFNGDSQIQSGQSFLPTFHIVIYLSGHRSLLPHHPSSDHASNHINNIFIQRVEGCEYGMQLLQLDHDLVTPSLILIDGLEGSYYESSDFFP